MTRITITHEQVDVSRPKVAAPGTSDPATLIRHLQAYEPVKLALARDLPLTVRKIEKTARGIKAMMKEDEGEETLHKGLGWLHYRTVFHTLVNFADLSRDLDHLRYYPRILHPPRLTTTQYSTGSSHPPNRLSTPGAKEGSYRSGQPRLFSWIRIGWRSHSGIPQGTNGYGP